MHNNWLTTNLSHRCTNPKLNFLVDICPYPVKILNFDDECNITAKIIANFNKKISLPTNEVLFLLFPDININRNS